MRQIGVGIAVVAATLVIAACGDSTATTVTHVVTHAAHTTTTGLTTASQASSKPVSVTKQPVQTQPAASSQPTSTTTSGTGSTSGTAQPSSLPKAITEPDISSSMLEVKPAEFMPGAGDGWIWAGSTMRAPIDWRSWTATSALGYGDVYDNNCTPDCANGHWTGQPVEFDLSEPRWVGGQLIFTSLAVSTRPHPPAGGSPVGQYSAVMQHDTHAGNLYTWHGASWNANSLGM